MKSAIELQSALPTINGKKPVSIVRTERLHYAIDGQRFAQVLSISAEEGDGIVDFYLAQFIHPKLEAFAAKHGGYWEWDSPGSISFWEV